MSATYHAGGCVKRAYPSRAAALLHCDRIRETIHRHASKVPAGKKGRNVRRDRRVHPTGPQRAYACQHCGAWHLTSQGERAA